MDRVAAVDADISWANSTGNEPYPLEGLITDETALDNYERSHQWVSDNTQLHDDNSSQSEHELDETNNRNAQQMNNVGLPMFKMTAPGDTTVEVPTDWAMYMAAISKKIESLNESIREMSSRTPHPAANSTRMDVREHADRRVTFENTPARQDHDRQGPLRQQALQTSNEQRLPPSST